MALNIREKVIEIFNEKKYPPLYISQIMEILDISRGDQGILESVLDQMVKEGQLVVTRKGKYAIPKELGFLVGRLQGHAKGFGFLIPDDREEEDVFIAAENIEGAMHNDRIMVRLLSHKGSEVCSREGEVVRILERANKTVVGTFEKGENFGFVIPDDSRIAFDIFIPGDAAKKVESGYKVVAEIVRWPEPRRNPEGRIIEVLGHKDDVGIDILSVIRQFNLPEEFPEDVQEAARKIPQELSEEDMAGRKDLRALKTITIDGADAKDFDDAVSVKVLDNGNYLLGVHIADVSHYVIENSPLDKEALKRGTSIYLVDRVIPMLPEELSNGICSLNPNVDRLAISVFMEIDHNGKVVDYSIDESVIQSKHRMVYEDVSKILEDNDPELIEKYSDLVDDLKNMEKLYKILNKRREARGSIDFDLEETKIALDIKGKPIDVMPYERRVSNRIIEEFMLVCNETIAEHIYWQRIPFMYRVHEEPTVEKMLDFNEFIHNFGYHLKGIGGDIHPKVLQDLLKKIKGTPEEGIISAVMLRSLQKARYSHESLGHFGLATNYYCHFTSPIRRYPDLMIHRIIKDLLHNRMDGKRIKHLENILPEMADHCSQRERLADEAERETQDLKMAEYMVDKVGMEFEGIISGVTGFGIYVQLPNTVEGMVHINSIEDDYYIYDEKHYCLIGEHTRKIYKLGDIVKIRVIKADVATRNIDFVLAE